ncbi:MAG: PLP-dependent aminotransferase family protein [Candidatus Obscuribacterales bacterium]|nr:PLP-dependent aminotransferase family protein [Candidatus Obscuribacterales bacterium]
MSLRLFLSTDESIPLHRRLIAALIEAIESSRLEPGSLVPSTRELAQTLGLSRATVSKAYAELLRSSYLVTRSGGKTRVAETLPGRETTKRIVLPVRSDVDDLVSAYALRLMDSGIKSSWDQPYSPAPNGLIPVLQWKQILSKYCNNLDSSKINSEPFGEVPLRNSIATYLLRERGIHCLAEQIIVFQESQSGLYHISHVLLDEGDVVVVEDPCTVNARNIFLAKGARIIAVPVDENGLDVDALNELVPAQTRVKLIYVTPTFQDPSGVCMSMGRRQKLIAFARQHRSAIVEDAWDGSHNYIKNIPPPLYSLSQDANVFYICSFWKLLYPLSMVSCLVIPPRFAPYFKQTKKISQEASPGIENTLQEFIDAGHLEKHLKAAVRALTPVRQKVIETLLVGFGRAVTIRKQSSAYWLTVQFDPTLSSEAIHENAHELGLTLQPTDRYYADPEQSPVNEYIVPFASFFKAED